jgi:hypothetical protein
MAGVYEATLIGQAVVASSLAPEDGLFVHKELKRALEAFVLDGEMHAFYTFTPVQVTSSKVNVSSSILLLLNSSYSNFCTRYFTSHY